MRRLAAGSVPAVLTLSRRVLATRHRPTISALAMAEPAPDASPVPAFSRRLTHRRRTIKRFAAKDAAALFGRRLARPARPVFVVNMVNESLTAATPVAPDDLIDASGVAELLGLGQRSRHERAIRAI